MNGYNNKENEKGAFLLKFNSANKHLLYDTQVSTIYIDYLQTIIHEKQKKKYGKRSRLLYRFLFGMHKTDSVQEIRFWNL